MRIFGGGDRGDAGRRRRFLAGSGKAGEARAMPYLTTNDGVKLYFEESGAGRPILFIHEFSGDYRAWEHQVRYFARRYRCITYNARGYPPSEVPDSLDKYSQQRAVDDAIDALDHLKI